MPRTVQITIPPEKTNELVEEIKKVDGLIGLRVQKGISVKPKGDVITAEVTNNELSGFMHLLSHNKIISNANTSVTTSDPISIISKSSQKRINGDSSECVWEEMQAAINSQSVMTINSMLIMFLLGVIAVIGIVTNALHIVIGAMVIAPGFLPITRISLGIVSQYGDWKNGLTDTVKAYLALLTGAIITASVMHLLGKNLTTGDNSYLPAGVLISYWTNITTSTVLVDIAAAMVGALVIVTNRPVLTAGVMIALALIPATCIIGIGIVAGDWEITGEAFIRLLLDISIVAVFTAVIFFWKKSTIQRRKMFS